MQEIWSAIYPLDMRFSLHAVGMQWKTCAREGVNFAIRALNQLSARIRRRLFPGARMPVIAENISTFTPNTTYHATARAIGNLKPFRTAAQKQALLDRFAMHLDPRETADDWGRPHIKLNHVVEVIAFNPMDNHIHNLAHQWSRDGIQQLMSRVLSGHARWFNRDSGWRGKVFSPFGANPFQEFADPTQIRDMVAYIELNDPIKQFDTPFTSYQVLVGNAESTWYDPSTALKVFGGMDSYREFMNRRGPAIVRRKLIEWGIDPRKHPYRPI
jgi:REP element-mobilizing transposase RayT